MTRYSKWAVRISLIYLLVGATIGSMMLVSKAYSIYYEIFNYLPLHREYMMFGWFINLIFGVAYWMFPRFTPSKSKMEKPRGFVRAAWSSLVVLNAGLVIFTLSAFIPYRPSLKLTGRLLELGGTLLFMVNLWPRVKPMSDYG